MKRRLAIVSALLHSSHGGPATVVRHHYHALRQIMDVVVIGVAPLAQHAELLDEFPDCHLFPPAWPQRWFRGHGLADALWQILPDCDVVHAHMLWDHPVWAAWRTAHSLKKPFIITPHGSLMEKWRYQAMHKRLYRWLLLDHMLCHTSFLQALSEQEKSACQQAGVTTPIRVIANGLHPSAFLPGTGLAATHCPERQDPPFLLYLGRLWKEKGLDDLLTAWSRLSRDNSTGTWQLLLAGPDYRGYRQHLETRIAREGLSEIVHIQSEVTGQKKIDLFAKASAFVLPSYSEGLSSALLEAMAAGLPSVYTHQCHFPTLSQHRGGIEVPAGTTGVQQGIEQLLRLSPDERRTMGQQARSLAEQDYTMEKIALALFGLYLEAIHSDALH
ncbi:glycosyltransferase [Candidatus Magnetaquicoccus inordinatus]|uniref:glycosyltransferase n=1 Tax=Candidatus Magnetaquicoccus inordinatus TaxID=2496818 RepID=UPI00102D29EA|nr:glycosyltransferase [Candidatus Magnetaquicoccus inordinatus]